MKTSTIKRVIDARIIRWTSDNFPVVRIKYVDKTGKRKQKTFKRGVRALLGAGDSNTKLAKNDVITYGLSLSPYDQSGIGNTCAHASPGCAAACLNDSGLGSVFPTIQLGRIAKTVVFYQAREWFLERLAHEIELKQRAADGADIAIRLNVFSDIPWERIFPELFARFPNVNFYDYTKNPKRAGQLLPNYWLTFSRSETNETQALRKLNAGVNVSVVFADDLPKRWNGFTVVEGDQTDLRYLDPRGLARGYVIGLSLKSANNSTRFAAIESGFAV